MMLYLMRHGETDWNRQKRIQGRKDIGLNGKGIRQVDDASKWFMKNSIVIHRIVSSPLHRAAQSALIIAEKLGLSVEFDVRFAERAFGELEGLTLDEIAMKFNILEPEDVNSPLSGIESATELHHRVCQGLNALSAHNAVNEARNIRHADNVLIVTHGSIIRALTGIPEIVKNGAILPCRKLS